MSDMNAWPAEKLYITYCVPTPAATFWREHYTVGSKACIASCYFVRTFPFVSPPDWLCKLPRYTLYGNGEETSVFNYSAWLTAGHKQYKAFHPSSTGLTMNYEWIGETLVAAWVSLGRRTTQVCPVKTLDLYLTSSNPTHSVEFYCWSCSHLFQCMHMSQLKESLIKRKYCGFPTL